MISSRVRADMSSDEEETRGIVLLYINMYWLDEGVMDVRDQELALRL